MCTQAVVREGRGRDGPRIGSQHMHADGGRLHVESARPRNRCVLGRGVMRCGTRRDRARHAHDIDDRAARRHECGPSSGGNANHCEVQEFNCRARRIRVVIEQGRAERTARIVDQERDSIDVLQTSLEGRDAVIGGQIRHQCVATERLSSLSKTLGATCHQQQLGVGAPQSTRERQADARRATGHHDQGTLRHGNGAYPGARYTRGVNHVPEPPRRVELTITTRTLVRLLVTIAVFLLIIYTLWQVRDIGVLVLISAFLALALNPLVTVLEVRLGGRRGVASVIVVIGLLVVLIIFLAALLTPLYSEVRSFATRAPSLIDELRHWGPFARFDNQYNLVQRIRDGATQYSDRLPAQADNLLGVATAVVAGFGKAVTVMFMTLFLLLEIPRFLRTATELLRPGHADRSLQVFDQVNGTIARWTAGVLFIAFIAGTTVGITAWVLGVPFALALGLLVGVLDLIPLIGATIGSTVAVLVALTQSFTAGLIMLVLAVAYQFIENHIIQPVVMRKSIDVSPFIVLVSVLVGASLLGIIGALLAIPVAGSVQVVLRTVLDARRQRVAAERQLMLDLAGASSATTEGDSP